jgi:predicted nucleic acid-binding protein
MYLYSVSLFQTYNQTSKMPKIVISDTSTLILFHKIGEFNLLHQVYGELITTPEIANEFGESLPEWITIQSAKDLKYQDFLCTQVDPGEASAIALATEYEDVLLLLDDLKARKLANQLKLKVTGTLGVIHKARQLSVINKVRPLIEKLKLTDFRIADNIVEEILKLNNE